MLYRYGGSFVKSSKDWSYTGLGPILLKYLDCPVNATHIDQCPFREYTERDHRLACYSYSDHRKDVNLQCRDEPFEGTVRSTCYKLAMHPSHVSKRSCEVSSLGDIFNKKQCFDFFKVATPLSEPNGGNEYEGTKTFRSMCAVNIWEVKNCSGISII